MYGNIIIVHVVQVKNNKSQRPYSCASMTPC